MFDSAIGRLRLVGIAEAMSYLVLLAVAMPLKYLADMPTMVRVVGWIHGGLFTLFSVALIQVWRAAGWSFQRAAIVGLAALLPFGPLLLDGQLRREQESSCANRP